MVFKEKYSKNEFIKIVMSAYDSLAKDKVSCYELGRQLVKEEGTHIKPLVQEAGVIISSYIADLLVELFHPLLTEDHENYVNIRKRCYSEFASGIVRGS